MRAFTFPRQRGILFWRCFDKSLQSREIICSNCNLPKLEFSSTLSRLRRKPFPRGFLKTLQSRLQLLCIYLIRGGNLPRSNNSLKITSKTYCLAIGCDWHNNLDFFCSLRNLCNATARRDDKIKSSTSVHLLLLMVLALVVPRCLLDEGGEGKPLNRLIRG